MFSPIGIIWQQATESAGLPSNRRSTPEMGIFSQESSKIDISGNPTGFQGSPWLGFSQQFQPLLKNGNLALQDSHETDGLLPGGKKFPDAGRSDKSWENQPPLLARA